MKPVAVKWRVVGDGMRVVILTEMFESGADASRATGPAYPFYGSLLIGWLYSRGALLVGRPT